MDRLSRLPSELLLDIFVLSGEPSLAIASKCLHEHFSQASDRYRATWLNQLYSTHARTERLTRALRHPVCTLPIVELIYHGEERKMGDEEGSRPINATARKWKPKHAHGVEIPRRLFKRLEPGRMMAEEDNALLWALLRTFDANVNSSRGYPLARAIHARDHPLVTKLLDAGADPTINNNVAIMTAIKTGDVALVRLLLCRPRRKPGDTHVAAGFRPAIQADSKMLQAAVAGQHRDVADLLVSLGAAPNMATLKLLRR